MNKQGAFLFRNTLDFVFYLEAQGCGAPFICLFNFFQIKDRRAEFERARSLPH